MLFVERGLNVMSRSV